MRHALLLALLMFAAPAAASDLSDGDRAWIQWHIHDQIQAFGRDDGEAAFRNLTPDLKAQFGSPDRFMKIVRHAYQPVYRPSAYDFGEVRQTAEGITQVLEITGPDGERVIALYLFERQADGSLKNSGCLMVQPEPGDLTS